MREFFIYLFCWLNFFKFFFFIIFFNIFCALPAQKVFEFVVVFGLFCFWVIALKIFKLFLLTFVVVVRRFLLLLLLLLFHLKVVFGLLALGFGFGFKFFYAPSHRRQAAEAQKIYIFACKKLKVQSTVFSSLFIIFYCFYSFYLSFFFWSLVVDPLFPALRLWNRCI